MLKCFDGVKHVFLSFLRCCDIDLYSQSRGLDDPEVLARETVCNAFFFLPRIAFYRTQNLYIYIFLKLMLDGFCVGFAGS